MPSFLYEAVDFCAYAFSKLGIPAFVIALIVVYYKKALNTESDTNSKYSFITKTLNHFNKAFKNEFIRFNAYLDFGVLILLLALLYPMLGPSELLGSNLSVEPFQAYFNYGLLMVFGCFLVCVLIEIYTLKHELKNK